MSEEQPPIWDVQSEPTLRLYVQRLYKSACSQMIILLVTDKDGRIICKLEYSLPSRGIDWPTMLSMIKAVRHSINNSEIIDGEYFYRISPSINTTKRILLKAMETGISEFSAYKIPVSASEARLEKYLKETRRKFKRKVYIQHKHLVDFLILTKKIKIALDVIQQPQDINEAVTYLSAKKRELTRKGYLYYWITSQQLDEYFSKVVKTLNRIIAKAEVRPSGPLWGGVKIRENTPPVRILLKLNKRESVIGSRSILEIYKIRKTRRRRIYAKIGEIKMTGNALKFAQNLCDTFSRSNYFYSYKMEKYKELHTQLTQRDEVTVSVRKFSSNIGDVLTGKLAVRDGVEEIELFDREVTQAKKTATKDTSPPERTLKIEKVDIDIIRNLSESDLEEVVCRAKQLLRDDVRVKLESIPLEVIRSFIEKFVYKIEPISNEELENLISYGLVDRSRKRKRTLIGRMVKKALKEIIEEYRAKDNESRN